MVEPDKIRKIAERLTEQMPSHFRKAETTRAERMLREDLEGLMVAAEAIRLRLDRGELGIEYKWEANAIHKEIENFARLLAEYGWPWRKNGDTSQGRG